jgi:RNA polymerase sigma-70 factor (ECF subfamily)
MAETDSFAGLMGRLHSDRDASREVFQRFEGQLQALARRQFAGRLGRRIDAEDVVQSAFKSFFVRHRQGKLRVGGENALWGLLTLITLRKCADRAEYLRAQRRDVMREVSAGEAPGQTWELAFNREPTPQQAAILAETIEHLHGAVDADERPVLELSLEGYTAVEISLRLGRALRTIQRLREQIRRRLERMRQEH